MTDRRPLTRAEISRLGGLTAADNLSAEQRAARAMKAGNAAREKLGRAHYVRIALMRHGRLPRPAATTPHTKKGAPAKGSPNSTNGAK